MVVKSSVTHGGRLMDMVTGFGLFTAIMCGEIYHCLYLPEKK